jgi:NAD(P)-dependent dehydrogenase (short-subunit alcohol dehydrogenase family)
MSLANQTVMITGAAGNMGRCLAGVFFAAGANLVLVDRRRNALEAAFGQEHGQQLFAPADLLDPAQAQAITRLAIQHFGKVDVLCNMAGGFHMGQTLYEMDATDWDFMFDINVRTMLHAVRAVVPFMIENGGGKIVTVGANSALRGRPRMGPYCAAKGAVIRLTESLSAELCEKNINVNCVLPSIISSPENLAAMPDEDHTRWVKQDDLANVIRFLASDEARAIHGVALPVCALS